ncbi:MAG: alpha/beta hydrolase family protein [Omnitrophica WOR_2 bacterium]
MTMTYIWYPVKENESPETAGAPYPLVIYSTGGWTNATLYTYFLEVLASYGFVVMAVDPRDAGQDATDWSPTVINRTQDTRLLISQADKMTAPGGQLAGLIDMDKIASTGYSAGGWTALVGAGAQWSFGWCTAHSYSSDYCGSDHQKLADGFGLKSVPDGLWPAMNDPRVKTVVAMAPVGWVFGAEFEGVSAIKVPALIMAAADDTICPAERRVNAIYQHLGSQKKSLIQFEGKDHSFFGGVDYDRDRITHFLTAYLLAELKGDAQAAKALAPANVTFPGVKFETTEFK